MDPKSKEELDNRANQLNPSNDAYHQSRGLSGVPNDVNDDDDDDDSKGANYDDGADYPDDNESFSEEWIPQDAW